ncbi:MAG: hypothetical protein ABIL76_03005 [candidate division WOR-3 bacterium]
MRWKLVILFIMLVSTPRIILGGTCTCQSSGTTYDCPNGYCSACVDYDACINSGGSVIGSCNCSACMIRKLNAFELFILPNSQGFQIRIT